MRTKDPELFPILAGIIESHLEKYGTPPTVAEVAQEAGIGKATAYRYLTHMRENGMLGGTSGHRGFVTKEAMKTRMESTSVPIVGMIACGTPKLAEENIEEYVRLWYDYNAKIKYRSKPHKQKLLVGLSLCQNGGTSHCFVGLFFNSPFSFLTFSKLCLCRSPLRCDILKDTSFQN